MGTRSSLSSSLISKYLILPTVTPNILPDERVLSIVCHIKIPMGVLWDY